MTIKETAKVAGIKSEDRKVEIFAKVATPEQVKAEQAKFAQSLKNFSADDLDDLFASK